MGLFSDILLTVDYDHTMTGTNNTVPAQNLEAIRYFMENGGAFTLNTGRSIPMSRALRETVPVNAPMLLYNGAVALDTKTEEMLFCHTIPLDMRQTISWCLETFPDLIVEVQSLEAHYCFQNSPEWYEFRGNNHCARRFATLDEDLGPFLKFTIYLPIRGKAINDMYTATDAERARLLEAERLIRERYGHAVDLFRSAARIMDVQAKGVSKDKAARELQKRLGRKILVCAGDGENDLPMLKEADYAFSPADGAMAAYFPTVCNCGEGAVADVIYEKIPEIVKNKS